MLTLVNFVLSSTSCSTVKSLYTESGCCTDKTLSVPLNDPNDVSQETFLMTGALVGDDWGGFNGGLIKKSVANRTFPKMVYYGSSSFESEIQELMKRVKEKLLTIKL